MLLLVPLLLSALAAFHGVASPLFCGGPLGMSPAWRARGPPPRRGLGESPPSRSWQSLIEDLAVLQPELRLKAIVALKDGQLAALGYSLMASNATTYEPWLKELIETCCNECLGVTSSSSLTAVSVRTRTAIYLGGDLDVNVETPGPVARADREPIAKCLEQSGRVDVIHVGSTCITLDVPSLGHEVDVAFSDATFEAGALDRTTRDRFLSKNQDAQNAVKVFKFAFHGVNGLSGVLCERLAMEVHHHREMASAGDGFMRMVRAIVARNNIPLQNTINIAMREHEGDTRYREALDLKVKKMRNVINTCVR